MKSAGSERQICSKERPYTKDAAEASWQHPDARDVGSGNDDCGEYDRYRCPHCGLDFKVTVPD